MLGHVKKKLFKRNEILSLGLSYWSTLPPFHILIFSAADVTASGSQGVFKTVDDINKVYYSSVYFIGMLALEFLGSHEDKECSSLGLVPLEAVSTGC